MISFLQTIILKKNLCTSTVCSLTIDSKSVKYNVFWYLSHKIKKLTNEKYMLKCKEIKIRKIACLIDHMCIKTLQVQYF